MRETYEVLAIRSGRWWALETPAIQRARSQARRLDQAEPIIRDALAMVLDVDPNSFDVNIRPILNPDLDQMVTAAARARETAATARADATHTLRELVMAAARERYTARDDNTSHTNSPSASPV